MNKEIIFKWDKECDRKSIEKCIWKSELLKGKSHCSFFKLYKNLLNLLEVLLGINLVILQLSLAQT